MHDRLPPSRVSYAGLSAQAALAEAQMNLDKT